MSASGSINRLRVDGPNSKKLLCEKLEDRISRLPDELRTNIISRLPFRDALQTCLLSKSWKHIFSALPNLAFLEYDFPNVPNIDHRFAALIDWTFANRDDSDIFSLVIHINFLQRSGLTLKNAWLNFAVEHNVQRLSLIADIDETAGLSSSLFTSRSLKMFRLTARVQLLKLPSAIHLPNLKEMSLESVIFPDNTLTEELFTGCPLLVFLCIRSCGIYPLTRLKIPCPRLKTLWISDCHGIHTCILDLQGTCIEKFFYLGTLAQNFEFGNMSHLLKVVFNFARDPHDRRSNTELAPVAWKILREFCHARELILSVLFYKVLLGVGRELWQLSSFKNLATVRLFLWPSAENEEIVMTLLSKCCCVQNLTFVIANMMSSERKRRVDFDDTYYMELNPEKYRLEGVFEHLEHLQIDNFEGFALETGVLLFFLQNAKSLTRVTIRTPRATIKRYGKDHLGSRANRSLEQKITDKLRPFSDAYPTVAIRVVEVEDYQLVITPKDKTDAFL